MDKPNIRIPSDITAMSLAALQAFTTQVNISVKSNGRAMVALSGGSTPLPLFQLLAEPPYKCSVPWEKIYFFWVDERCVPPEDVESNYGQAWKSLLSKVPVENNNIHRIKGELASEESAQDYIAQLSQFAPSNLSWPIFDFVLLGMGADGHTASLFPGHFNPAETTSAAIAVTADYMGRPANRVTLTPMVINSARQVLFLISGENKAQAVARVIKGPYDPFKFPAQRIKPVIGEVTWLIDQPAASLLIS